MSIQSLALNFSVGGSLKDAGKAGYGLSLHCDVPETDA